MTDISLANLFHSRSENSAPHTGDRMEDGSIYLRRRQGRDWFAAAEDSTDAQGNRLRLNFKNAAAFARHADVDGHHDWALPDADLLYSMKDAKDKGAFRGTYHIPQCTFLEGLNSGKAGAAFDEGRYWSNSTYTSELANDPDAPHVTCLEFGRGFTGGDVADSPAKSLIRLVRSEPVVRNKSAFSR